MTTLVRADEKGRICLRGTKKGQEYLIKVEKNGWWVTPVKPVRPPKKPQEWAGSELSLVEHLRGLAESGLQIEQTEISQQKVPKCRF